MVRSFSYFSHLANIAEDAHHRRRTRAHAIAGSKPRIGTIRRALDDAKEAGITRAELQTFFENAFISPVLTAHPTEVRRRSTQTWEMAVARPARHQYNERDMTEEEREQARQAVREAVLSLWQTSLLRRRKLTVIDEVANGLTYYDIVAAGRAPRRLPGAGTPGRELWRHERAAAADPVLPAHGQLDRRRPRRQSVRHRGRGRRDGADARRQDHPVLSRRDAEPAQGD